MELFLMQMAKAVLAMIGAGLYGLGFHGFVQEMTNGFQERKRDSNRFWRSIAMIMVGLPLFTIVEYGFLFAILAMLLPRLKERWTPQKS